MATIIISIISWGIALLILMECDNRKKANRFKKLEKYWNRYKI